MSRARIAPTCAEVGEIDQAGTTISEHGQGIRGRPVPPTGGNCGPGLTSAPATIAPANAAAAAATRTAPVQPPQAIDQVRQGRAQGQGSDEHPHGQRPAGRG
jgi:hypothetical protein